MNLGKESEFIEFKLSFEELDTGIRSISAMLNRHKVALVYFGVKAHTNPKVTKRMHYSNISSY